MNGIERLEEIKSRVWKEKGTYAMGDYSQREGCIYTLSDYDYEWLIEQAKRVQELEELVEDYKTINKELHQRGRKVRKQNKRYWEFINNVKTAVEQPIGLDELFDVIQREYEALKESK